MRSRLAALIAVVVLLAGLSSSPVGAQESPVTPGRVGPPSSIAVLGDSISTATGTGTLGGETPANSWSTGTRESVDSTYLRLLRLEPAIAGNNHTMASNGRRMVHMAEQAAAMPAGTEYVQVQLGGNDLCQPSVPEMTSVEDYRAQFVAGLRSVAERSPDALVSVQSVPDIFNLWYIRYAPSSYNGQESNQASWARTFVGLGVIPCDALLANPSSTSEADMARRFAVRDRTIAFNAVLEEECARVLRCRFDDHATFDLSSNRVDPPHGPLLPREQWGFTDLDISRNTGSFCPLSGFTGPGCGDHFHPSLTGQAKLAATAWEAGYDFTDVVAPALTVTAAEGWTTAPTLVSMAATDEAGVRGIEHRTGPGAWTPTPGDGVDITVEDEGVTSIEVRGLDVNGNVSDSRSVTVQVDDTDPTVQIDAPADGDVLTLGQALPAAYSCADELSGVATCIGTSAVGDDVDTATVGPKTFAVTATDLAGNEHTETVSYTVVAPGNQAPVADAGGDQVVASGGEVALDGSASSDPDGDDLSYSWLQTGGPSVTLTGAATATPTFAAPVGPADLRFELTVSDGELSAVDATSVTVEAAPVEDGAVTGTVTSADDGAALPRIRVDLYSSSATGRLATTVTDASGNWTIADLPVGDYRVKLFDPSGAFATEWYDDARTYFVAQDLTVTGGGSTRADQDLSPAATTGVVTGRVTAAGSGRPGVTVNIYTPAGFVKNTITDGTGAYALGNLAPGTYRVRFLDFQGRYAGEWYADRPTYFTADDIAVTRGGSVAVDADLAVLPG